MRMQKCLLFAISIIPNAAKSSSPIGLDFLAFILDLWRRIALCSVIRTIVGYSYWYSKVAGLHDSTNLSPYKLLPELQQLYLS